MDEVKGIEQGGVDGQWLTQWEEGKGGHPPQKVRGRKNDDRRETSWANEL